MSEINGKKYEFVLGKIIDELVEECRTLLKEHCKILVEDDETGKNTVVYSIGLGEKEIDDELLFQSAICHYKDFLIMQIKERNKHIILVNERREEY